MNNTAPNGKPPRVPFLSEMDRKILGYYACTAAMMLCIVGAIIAVATTLGYSNEQAPPGGFTLLWRVPMALCWAGWGFVCYYKLAKFWDPSDMEWVDNLLDRLRRRR